METLESFRRRITVATEMQAVVRTMKTLAAVNIRQGKSAVHQAGTEAARCRREPVGIHREDTIG